MNKYCVTIVRYGCLFVEAESPEQAMYIADHQKTETVNWSDDWMPTDADEADEVFKDEDYIKEAAF